MNFRIGFADFPFWYVRYFRLRMYSKSQKTPYSDNSTRRWCTIWIIGNSRKIGEHMVQVHDRLGKAPLIRTELNFIWGESGNRALVQPRELRGLLASGEVGAEYEWLTSMDSIDRSGEFDNLYRATYSKGESLYTWTLAHGLLTVASDDTYQTWSEFQSEALEKVEGLSPLLAAQDTHITSITLQYVDVFSSDIIGGRSAGDFLRSDLGLSLTVPERLQYLSGASDKTGFGFQTAVEIRDDLFLMFNIGESEPFGAADSVLSTIEVLRVGIDSPNDSRGILAILGELHHIADNTFFELIEPISDRFSDAREN